MKYLIIILLSLPMYANFTKQTYKDLISDEIRPKLLGIGRTPFRNRQYITRQDTSFWAFTSNDWEGKVCYTIMNEYTQYSCCDHKDGFNDCEKKFRRMVR